MNPVSNLVGVVPLTLAVTAHRHIRSDEIPVLERRLRSTFVDLARRFPDTPLRLLSGLAEGGDRLAARVALELDLDVIAALPFAPAEYE